MNNYFLKKTEDINALDLDSFLAMRIEEGQYIEYKSEMYSLDDAEAKREMLRDIASFANAYGGYLFIGIEEQDKKPTSFRNVPNAEHEKDRIDKSCLSSIEPRIPTMVSKVVRTNSQNDIIIIHIPPSPNKPHMVTFRGLDQFWIRHQDDKSPMSLEEIRDAFMLSRSVMVEIKEFLKERKHEINAEIGRNPTLILGCSPIPLEGEIIDISETRVHDFLLNPPNQTFGSIFTLANHSFPDVIPEPTLMGIKGSHQGFQVELFRNGYYEARIPDTIFSYRNIEDNLTYINNKNIVEHLVNYFRAAQALYGSIIVGQNIISYVHLYNVRAFQLHYGRRVPTAQQGIGVWDKDHLELPTKQLLSLETPDRIAESFLIRLWNAFGFDRAPYFNNHIYSESRSR